jgi:hypothetical protein
LTWNYRIIRHVDPEGEWYGIHEVYYDDQGQPHSLTANPVPIDAETPEELRRLLDEAFEKPVLNYDDF